MEVSSPVLKAALERCDQALACWPLVSRALSYSPPPMPPDFVRKLVEEYLKQHPELLGAHLSRPASQEAATQFPTESA
jgi:hypothetical protein